MRYIFFSLLLLNLGYFGFGQMQEVNQPPSQVAVAYPDGTQSLYLLSENAQGGTTNSARQQASRVINRPVRGDKDTAEEATCLAIGPFTNLFSGQSVAEQLAALEVESELRAVDRGTGESDFRVLIPPTNSLQEAFRKLRELKSRNIDSYVITQGPDAPGISLGVFSTREAAANAQAQRLREGYTTIIVEIPRLAREFWIFGKNGRGLVIEPALWRSLVSQDQALEQRLMVCPDQAST
ncbi:MAG: hypothetical protein WD002_11400 [Pseudomonadales bacterium]